jgi:hypothetical protein
MRTSLPLLAVLAFALVAITYASVDIQVLSPNLQSRSLAFDQIESPLRLTNITRWDAPSSATTRDLDIVPRGPTGVSTTWSTKSVLTMVFSLAFGLVLPEASQAVWQFHALSLESLPGEGLVVSTWPFSSSLL